MKGKVHVLYDDDAIVVVDKPSGMVVHPAPGYETGALSDELVKQFPLMKGVGGEGHDGVVHRLDRDTSGVMVFAKTREAYLFLRKEFESHERVRKTYLAVTRGIPKKKSGTLENWIAKKGSKMAVVDASFPGALKAVTQWEVLSRNGAAALTEFRILTGRTHQIRVHASYLGAPIYGDAIYAPTLRAPRLLLHSVELSFVHPLTGEEVSFQALPPTDIVYPRVR